MNRCLNLWPQDASVELHYMSEGKNILFKVDWVDVKLFLPAVMMKVNLLAFQITQNSPPRKKACCLCNICGGTHFTGSEGKAVDASQWVKQLVCFAIIIPKITTVMTEN